MGRPRNYFRILLKAACFTSVLTVLWTVSRQNNADSIVPEDAREFIVRVSPDPGDLPLERVPTRTGHTLSSLSKNSSVRHSFLNSKPLPATVTPEGCDTPIDRPLELTLPPRDTWQQCEPASSYVFSAFVDTRQVVQWRLVIYSLRVDPIRSIPSSSLKCRMWLPGEVDPVVVGVERVRFQEWKQYRRV